MEFHLVSNVFITTVLVGFLGLCFRFYNEFVGKPNKLRSIMMTQGIGGPPPTLLIGNVLDAKRYMNARSKTPLPGVPTHHDASTLLFPFFQEWRKQYGDVFVCSLGNITILHVTHVEMVREMSICTSLDLGRPSRKGLINLFGQGIATSNGPHWAMQRKILAPSFFKHEIKDMVQLMQESATDLSTCWNTLIDANGGMVDISVDEHLARFSEDVILKASLGSNYSKRSDLFRKTVELQGDPTKKLLDEIPGMKFVPLKTNREAWAVGNEIKYLILKLVEERKGADCDDLLQIIVDGANRSGLSKEARDEFIVDNFKQIYVGAYETTAITATWCLMLLAAYPDWQQRVRTEVLEICKAQIPDAGLILKMKQLDMVVNETLRLYTPAPAVARNVVKEMKIGNLMIPKGVMVWVDGQILHTDPAIWGTDSLEFKPERFANGVSGACKYPCCYMPFGFGPRSCMGENLAVMEVKMIVTHALSRFSFTLSPSYTHSLTFKLLVKPEHGVNLCIKKLN